jgi:hypothetical protein
MKHKILMVLASFAVVAMIGTANADMGISVDNPQITVVVGADGTQYVTVTTPSGIFTGNIKLMQIVLSGGTEAFCAGDPGDCSDPTLGKNPADYFAITINGNPTANPQLIGNNLDPVQTFAVKYTNNKGAQNGNYKVLYQADWTCTGLCTSSTGLIDAEASVLAIPEFPAVALPVAAVIGLVLFFQHRKKRKEE